jgi:adenylosuccinate synthase
MAGIVIVIVGTQWGDEGKGKIVDILASSADLIVRFQGGSNAGHTVVIGDKKVILHQIPSGILSPRKKCIIGNGVVLDLEQLLKEISDLKSQGYMKDDNALLISEEAQLVMPYHKKLDVAREKARGKGKIGTTGRGIGPAYEDKVARVGIRLIDIFDPEVFRSKLEQALPEKNWYLTRLGEEGFDLDAIFQSFREMASKIKKHVANTSLVVNEGFRKKKNVLLEGAQGTMLDIDHGTYPYVTSSNTVAAQACTGSGIGPTMIDRVIGVSKAYTTRVGGGPFPTELTDETGERLREKGGEYGATTGRPRRCGWFDALVVRYAVRVNGIDSIALTKLDVLNGFSTLKICTGYRFRGKTYSEVPSSLRIWQECKPVYEEMDGWSEDISAAREVENLPRNAKRYVREIEKLIGAKIMLVSIGNERKQTILLENPFKKVHTGKTKKGR